MVVCRKCGKGISGNDLEMIETVNYIYHFCSDCAFDIEELIENSLNAEEAKR